MHNVYSINLFHSITRVKKNGIKLGIHLGLIFQIIEIYFIDLYRTNIKANEKIE